MARAVLHNSNHLSADAARAAIDLYFADRNRQSRDNPKRASKRIWGDERVPPAAPGRIATAQAIKFESFVLWREWVSSEWS